MGETFFLSRRNIGTWVVGMRERKSGRNQVREVMDKRIGKKVQRTG